MRPAPRPVSADDPLNVAAGWVERLTAAEPSAAELEELRAWIAADPMHKEAYEQVRAVWTALPKTQLGHKRLPLRLVGGTALAACLALFVFLTPGFHDHVTAVGQVQRLTLPDGSTAWLDSGSAIDLAFDDRQRTIHLVRGRMAIDVAHESARPLAVMADGATITDVGTVFSVDTENGLSVSVERGEVNVVRGNEAQRLETGEAGTFDRPSPLLRSVRTGEFAWRDGRILFDNVTLGQALAELGRYHAGRIVLLDRDLAQRRISGTLFTGRVDEGLTVLARSQHLHITHLPWLVLVSEADKNKLR